MSGIEVCRQIRRRSETRDLPVIMVTARTEDQDAVRGLNTGADDYITKPFSMEALLARMRALLRRANAVPAKGQLNFHDVTMDLAAHRVQRNGRPIHLGPTEFRLLEFFMQHPGRVFSREELLDAVWGPDIHVEPRTVDVHIRRLRKSLNGDGELDVVRTVRAAGYALDTEPTRGERLCPRERAAGRVRLVAHGVPPMRSLSHNDRGPLGERTASRRVRDVATSAAPARSCRPGMRAATSGPSFALLPNRIVALTCGQQPFRSVGS